MPNIQSAKKKMRQDAKRTAKNTSYRSKIDDVIKQVKKSGKKAKGKELVAKAYSAIDKAAKKNVIHKNKAGRLKKSVSRLVSSK